MSESYAHEHKAGYCRVCELERDLAAAQAELRDARNAHSQIRVESIDKISALEKECERLRKWLGAELDTAPVPGAIEIENVLAENTTLRAEVERLKAERREYGDESTRRYEQLAHKWGAEETALRARVAELERLIIDIGPFVAQTTADLTLRERIHKALRDTRDAAREAKGEG